MNLIERRTARATLEHAKRSGFEPKTVILADAGTGTFGLCERFPKARHILIDPLEEDRPYMDEAVRKLYNTGHLVADAAHSAGTITINVHWDFHQSSVYNEFEGSDVDSMPMIVPAITLGRTE